MSEDHKTVGARRRWDNGNQDVHATGKAVREQDVHATGKAERNTTDVHSTGKAARGNADAHATGKAVRRGADNLRPFEQKEGAQRPANSSEAKASGVQEWPAEFELNGLKYKNEGVLSNSSGEAIVFTVTRGGKKFALKIYYYDPDHRPNHAILEKIRQLGDSGLLVNIVSHGEWKNPNTPDEINDYELMDFCEGGSLDGVVMDGNEKALTEVAVKMGAAIDFLSKHGILHRDIKPGNFFYADKDKTQIVLADFGISAECPAGGTCKIDEMRSPVYASPEFYTNVPGEPAEVGVESDFFSLGVSLLCLWMGKAKLTANESQLLKSKMNETLPMPKDMSPHMTSLIRALTRLKMSDRATFDDIKRWVKGEDLDTGTAQAVNSDFHIVFNSAKNQIASSPSELAHLLLDDKVLGKKYLYSGRITRWLEETGRNEIAVNIEDIVENIYPSNQQAGLLAVAYMLDPSLDYVAPDGNHYSDPAEISKLFLYNNQEMSSEITHSDSNFMVYLRALKLDKTATAITDYIKSDAYKISEEPLLNSYVACLYLALMLDPQMPLSVSTDTEEGWEDVDTVEEFIAVLHKERRINAINWGIISSPAFVVWLAARNPALAGKVRMLQDKATNDVKSIYYMSQDPERIVYELDPAMDYWYGTDPNEKGRTYSVEQIGGMLNDFLNEMQQGNGTVKGFFAQFEHMDSSRVGHYLRARGEQYFNFLHWNRYCTDCDDEENKQKAGDYDPVIGTYKSVAGFLGNAPYFTIGNQRITTLNELEKFPKKQLSPLLGGKVREMKESGNPAAWLDAWIAVFFQENPKLNLSKKFTYEKETAKCVEFISSIDPDNYFAKRYRKAISEIDASAHELKQSDKNIKGKRNFFLLSGLVPTIIAFIGSWIFSRPEGNPISGHFFGTSLVCFIGMFVFFWAAFGFGTGFWFSMIGSFVAAGILWAGFAWFPSILYLAGGAVLLGCAAYFITQLLKRQKVDTGGVEIRGDEFEYRQLDALYFAYHQEGDNLDNVIKKYAEMQQSYDDTTREDLSTIGWMWASIAWSIFAIWFFATPQISGGYTWVKDMTEIKAKANQWIVGQWTIRYGNTKIVCNIDTVTEKKNIRGTMVIAGQAPVKAIGSMTSYHDTIPESFTFFPEGSKYNVQTVDVTYSRSDKTFNGYYYDRKGIMHQATITPPAKLSPKSSNKKSGTSTKSKSKSSKEPKAPQQTESEAQEAPKQESENLLENETSPVSGLWKDTM